MKNSKLSPLVAVFPSYCKEWRNADSCFSPFFFPCCLLLNPLIFHMLLLIVVRFYFLQKNIFLVNWDQFGFIWKPPHAEIDASSQILICLHTSLWHTSCCWPRTNISCFWNFSVWVLILIVASSGDTTPPCYVVMFSRFQSWIIQSESGMSRLEPKIWSILIVPPLKMNPLTFTEIDLSGYG